MYWIIFHLNEHKQIKAILLHFKFHLFYNINIDNRNKLIFKNNKLNMATKRIIRITYYHNKLALLSCVKYATHPHSHLATQTAVYFLKDGTLKFFEKCQKILKKLQILIFSVKTFAVQWLVLWVSSNSHRRNYGHEKFNGNWLIKWFEKLARRFGIWIWDLDHCWCFIRHFSGFINSHHILLLL